MQATLVSQTTTKQGILLHGWSRVCAMLMQYAQHARHVALLALGFIFVVMLIATSVVHAQVCANPGIAGITYTSPVNTYFPGTSNLSGAGTSVSVGAMDSRGGTTPIAVGDLVLIIQMQGADIDTSNNNRYGDGSGDGSTGYTTSGDYAGGNLNNANFVAGRYEYAVAASGVSAAGGTLNLIRSGSTAFFTRTATASLGKQAFQVVRVPQYSSLIVAGAMQAPPWNGVTGGVVAVDVAGAMRFAGGTIDVAGRGFRGGGSIGTIAYTNFRTVYVTNTDAADPGGGIKGEGIAGTPARVYNAIISSAVQTTGEAYPGPGGLTGDFARGAPGNAGGGSNQHNSGGGGGGNGGRGGSGGRTWNQNQDNYSGEDFGGFGGERTQVADASRIYMGGGGGSADINNQNAPFCSGGAGGGIVMIRAGSITGSGRIDARGAAALNGNTSSTDGCGGGGAGGTVLMTTQSGALPFGVSVDISGGRGGNSFFTGPNETDGPGGGGAGGRFLANTSGVFVSASGGDPGLLTGSINNFANGTSVGARPGESGTINTAVSLATIPGTNPGAACRPAPVVTKTTSTPTVIQSGTSALYTVTVTNTGNGPAQQIVVNDTLPAPFSFAELISVTLNGGATRPVVVNPVAGDTALRFGQFNLPGTAPGPAGSVVINFRVNINSAAIGTYQNPASVTLTDPTAISPGQFVTPGGVYADGGAVGGNNYASASSTAEDVTIFGNLATKSFTPATIATNENPLPASSQFMTITVANPNASLPLTNLSLTDNFPSGLFVSPTPGAVSGVVDATNNTCGLTFTGGTAGASNFAIAGANRTIPPGATCTLRFNVASITAGPIVNVIPAGGVSGTIGSTLISNSQPVSASLNVVAPPIIVKSFGPNNIKLGDTSLLTITISNPPGNSVPLTGVSFSDVFPAGVQVASTPTLTSNCASFAITGATAGSGTISATGGTIAVNETCRISLNVTKASASPPGGDINTTSPVTATGPIALTGNTARDTLNVSAALIAPTLLKSFGPLSANAGVGNSIDLLLFVQNPNTTPLTVQSLVDNFPSGMTLRTTSVINTCGLTLRDQTGAAPIAIGNTGIQLVGGTIPAAVGTTPGTCIVQVNVTAPAAGQYVNTSSALSLTNAPSSNIASATLTVVAAPVVTKTFTPSTVSVGGTSTLRISLRNPAGNVVPITALSFTDDFPAGLAVADGSSFANSCGGTASAGSTTGATSISASGISLPVNATCDISVSVVATSVGTLTNPAFSVTSSNAETATAAATPITVLNDTLPLRVGKSFSPERINAAGISRLSITIWNPNLAVALGGVNLVDNLAASNMSVFATPDLSSSCATLSVTGAVVASTSVTVSGTIPAGGMCVVSFNVTSITIGASTNTTGAISTSTPIALVGTTASASLFVGGISAPTVSKRFNPAIVPISGISTLTLTVSNPNPADDLLAVSLSDVFPSGMQVAPTPNLTNPCALSVSVVGGATSSVTIGPNTLPANVICPISIDVIAVPATVGNLTNSVATITSSNGGSGNATSAVLSVVATQAPVITKSFTPSAIAPNGSSVMTIDVTNPNSVFALTGVNFTDVYPAGLTNVATAAFSPASAAVGCTGTITSSVGGASVNLTGATIPISAVCRIEVTVTKATVGAVTNTTGTVAATGPNPVSGNTSSATLNVVTLLPPFIQKTFNPPSIAAGGTSTMALVITNQNSLAPLTGVAVVDVFPAGMEVAGTPVFSNSCGGTVAGSAAGSTTLSLSNGVIAAGQACIITVEVTKSTAGSVTNTTGNVSATGTGDGNVGSALLSVGATVLAPVLEKWFQPSTVTAGGRTRMFIRVSNPNTVGLTGIFLNDVFPGDLRVATSPNYQADPAGACGGLTPIGNTAGSTTFGFTGLSIPAGSGSCTITLDVERAGGGAGTLVNTTANIGATGPSALVGNAGSATVTFTAGSILPPSISKTFGATRVAASGTAPTGATTLTFTITNRSGMPLGGLSFNDVLPTGLTIQNATVTGTCNGTVEGRTGAGAFGAVAAGNTEIRLTGGTLALGTVAAPTTCTIAVNIQASASTGVRSNVTSVITSQSPNLTGNQATDILSVTAAGTDTRAPEISKTFAPVTQQIGQPTRLTLVVTNPSTSGAAYAGLSIVDPFPANMQVATPPNFSNSCANSTVNSGNTSGQTSINITGATLAINSSCAVAVDVVYVGASAITQNNVTNAVSITGPVALTGGTASATITWTDASDILSPAVVKSFIPATISLNGTSRLTLSIRNPNTTSRLFGVGFTDVFPAGLQVAATPNLSNTCQLPITGGMAAATSLNVTATTLQPGQVCDLSVDVTATTTGPKVNTTSAVSAQNASSGAPGSALLNVLQLAPPQIVKSFSPDIIAPNTVSTMTILLSNPNQNTQLTGVAFNDIFPTGLVVAATPNLTTTCGGTLQGRTGAGAFGTVVGGNTELQLASGVIDPAQTCRVTVNVTKATTGAVLNSVLNLSSTNGGAGNQASATLDVKVQPPVISKAFTPNSVVVGQPATLTIAIANRNPTIALTGVGFTDNYPGAPNLLNTAVTAVTPSGAPGCSGTAARVNGGAPGVSLSGATVPAGATCTYTMQVSSAVVGQFNNATSAVTSTEGGAGNIGADSLAVVASLLPPSVAKSFSPATISTGTTSQMSLAITNSNSGTSLAGIGLVDNFPMNLTLSGTLGVTSNVVSATNTCGLAFTNTSTNITVTDGSVPAGQTCWLIVNVTSNVAATYQNVTGAVSTTTPGAAAGNTATATLTVIPAAIAPVYTKTFSPAVIGNGQSTQLRITISNPNLNVPLTGVNFTDDFSGGSIVVSSDPSLANSCGGVIEGATGAGAFSAVTTGNNRLRLSNGVLTAGASCTVEVNVTSFAIGTNIPNPSVGGGFTNSANAGTTVLSGNNPSATLTVLGASLAKSFTPVAIDATTPAQTSVLTLTINNPSPFARQSGILFVDTLPMNVSVASTPNIQTNCPDGATVTNNPAFVTASGQVISITGAGASINAGVASCTITVNVSSVTPGTYANTGSGGSPNITGATRIDTTLASAALSVRSLPTLTKAFGASPISTGGVTTLTFTVTNTAAGNVARTGITFTDTLPMNVVIAPTPNVVNGCTGTPTISATAGAGAFGISGSGVGVAAGATCTISVNVTGAVAGTYVNGAAQISGTANVSNGVTDQTLVVIAPPTVTKAFTPATITLGSTSTMTLAVTNPMGNPATITGIQLPDTFPAGLTLQSTNATAVFTPAACGSITNTSGGPSALNDNNVRLNVVTLAPNSSCQVQVSIGAISANAFNNTTAAVTAVGPTALNGGTASATLTVNPATPVLTKAFAPTSVVNGGTTTLTFTVTQPSGNPTQTFSFTDTLPAGLVIATPNGLGGTCALGAGSRAANAGSNSITITNNQIVNPATTCTITVNVTTAATPTVGVCPQANNTNAAANVTGIANLNNSVGSQCLTVNAAVPTVNKAFTTDLVIGGTTSIFFFVSQPAGNPTQTFSFTDTLPPGLVASGGAVVGTCSGGSVSAAAGSSTITVTNRQIVNPATSCAIIVPITSSATPTVGTCPQVNNTNGNSNIGGTTNITATVTSGATSGSSTSGACVTVTAATPVLTKAFAPASIAVGGTSTLTFTVTQPSGNPTQTFSFTDTLPAGLIVATPNGLGGTCALGGGSRDAMAGSNSITITNNQIVNPATTCTITVNVTTAATPTIGTCPQANNTNAAANIGGIANLTNSVTSQCVSVIAPPTVTKTFTPASIGVGGTSSMVITVTNPAANSVNLTGVTINDTYTGTLTNNAVGSVVCSGAGTATLTGGTNAGTSVGFNGSTIVPGGTCTITQSVAATSTNMNVTTAPTTTGPVALTGVAANATLTVSQASVAKTFGATSINDGATTALVFTLTNSAGNPAQSGISVGDTLPSSLTINSATPAVTYSAGCSGPAAATYASGTGILSGITGVAMTAGTASCTITVAGVTNRATLTNASCATNPAAFTNQIASVSATNVTNASTAQCLVVNAVAPTLTKAWSSTTINDTGTTNLVFTLTNSGTNPAQSGISFTESLPSALRFNSATPMVTFGPGCAGSSVVTQGTPDTIALSGVTMAASTASCTITVASVTNRVGQVNSSCATNPAAFTNSAANIAPSSGVTNSVTNQCVVVNTIAPTLTKAWGGASIADGGSTALVFTLTNSGSNPAQSGIAFTESLPSALRFTSATPTVVASNGCTVTSNVTQGTPDTIAISAGSIPNGVASCTISVTGVTNRVGQSNASCATNPAAFTNTNMQISGLGNLTNGVTSQCLVVSFTAPTVAKTFLTNPIAAGGSSTLRITVTNPNVSPITVTNVTDTFPTTPGTGLVRAAAPNTATTCAGGTVSSTEGSVTLTGGTVPGGGSCTFQVDVTAASGGGYVNTIAAGALTTSAGSNGAAATDTLNVVSPTTVTKTFTPSTIGAGGTSSMVITVTNPMGNPANLTGVSINDAYTGTLTNNAAGAVVCSGAGTATLTGGANGGTSVGFNGGTIVPGGTCTITQSVTATTTNMNVTTAPTTTGPMALTGLAANASLSVNQASLTKAFVPATFVDGQTTVLRFTITNAPGNPAQANLNFVDNLPSGLRVGAGSVLASSTCPSAATVTTATSGGNTITVANATMTAGQASCTIDVQITNVAGQLNSSCATNPAPFTNGAANIGVTTNPVVSVTPSCVTVTAAAPTIAKAFTPATIAANGTSTITLTITNPNSVALTGANFTDTLTNMRVSGAQMAAGTCVGASTNAFTNNQTGLLNFTGLTVPANASCTVTLLITANTPGALPNSTSGVSSTQAPTGAVSNTATLTVNAVAPTIVKAFATPTIALGATSQIDFTISNTNGVPLTGAAFSDTLSNMFVSATGAATGTCAGVGTNNFTANQTGLLNFTGLTIPANGSCTVSIVVRSNTPGVHPNFATGVSSAEAPTGAVSATVNLTVSASGPTVNKAFSPATIVSGGTSTLTITLTNPNAAAVSITSFTDGFPTTPGTGLVRAPGAMPTTTCTGSTPSSTATRVGLTGGTIPANGSCTVTIDVTAATAGMYTNIIPANDLVTSAGNNTAQATATLTVTPSANVSVTKAGPAVIDWGTTITYTVTVSNAGPDAANGTGFTDNIPAAITGVAGLCAAGTGTPTCGTVNVAGNTVTSTITTLPAGSSVVFTITGTAPQSGTLANAASAIVPAGVSDPDDPTRVGAGNNTSNTVMTVVRAPNLALTKTATPIAMTSGGTGSFTITPNNLTGTAPTAGTITVTDILPTGLTGTSATGTGWNCTISGQTVSCTSTDVIAAGATGTAITINVNVGAGATPGFTNIASVSGGNEPAINNGNNTALVMVPVSGGVVSNFLTDGAQTGLPNTSVLYTHVFNGGTSGTVTFSFVRSAMPNTPGWTAQIYRDTNCNGMLEGLEGATEISNTPISLAAAGQVCIVVKSNIPGAAPVNAQDVITVTAAFTPTTVQPQSFTRVDITTVGNAVGGAGLTLSKAVRNITQGGALGTSNIGRPGDVIEYVVTYTNASNAPLSMITITDQVPAFTTLVTSGCTMPFPPSITSCTSSVTGTGAITWTLGGSLGSNQSGTVTFRVTIQ